MDHFLLLAGALEREAVIQRRQGLLIGAGGVALAFVASIASFSERPAAGPLGVFATVGALLLVVWGIVLVRGGLARERRALQLRALAAVTAAGVPIEITPFARLLATPSGELRAAARVVAELRLLEASIDERRKVYCPRAAA